VLSPEGDTERALQISGQTSDRAHRNLPVEGSPHAIAAPPPFLVSELAVLLDEEARSAHELTGLLWQNCCLRQICSLYGRQAVLLVPGPVDPLPQDHIETGLDFRAVILVLRGVPVFGPRCRDVGMNAISRPVVLWCFEAVIMGGDVILSQDHVILGQLVKAGLFLFLFQHLVDIVGHRCHDFSLRSMCKTTADGAASLAISC